MAINWSSLEKPAEVLNKLVVTIAVAIGGVWAWYTFNGELKRENARAQLEKLNFELENSRVYAIEVELQAKPLPNLGTEFNLEIEVLVFNKGSLTATIPLVEKSLRVTPITVPNLPKQPELAINSSVTPKPLMTDADGYLAEPKELRIPAGTKNRLLYLAQVDAPGRYLVEFSTPSKGFNPNASQSDELSESSIVDVPPIPKDSLTHSPPSRDCQKLGD